MDSGSGTRPLVVVVGQTGSGKSALALELAEKFNGEIICADSRTVYKGMDIGTAKPTIEEQRRIRHHLLDIASPDEPFSVADFKRLANQAIRDITSRGKVPILVGGSGLYIDAVLFDYEFAPVGAERDPANPRHLSKSEPRPQKPLRPNTLIIGLRLDRETLRKRIAFRVDTMVKNGFITELEDLTKKYGWSAPALQAPGYKAFREYMEGRVNLEEAKSLFVKNDLDLAKRQRTWFKRNKSIHWLDHLSEAVDITTTFLNKTLL